MVGGGFYDINDTVRPESSIIPDGVTWIKESVVSFDPENNSISLQSGASITYEYLVVAPGIQLNWNEVKGIRRKYR